MNGIEYIITLRIKIKIKTPKMIEVMNMIALTTSPYIIFFTDVFTGKTPIASKVLSLFH